MGAWTVDDNGEFTLDPTIEQHLEEAKSEGTQAHMAALARFVSEKYQEGARYIEIAEAQKVAGEAWREAVFAYINEFAPREYTYEELHQEMLRRVAYDDVTPEGVCYGLIIDALEGEI